MDIVIELVVRSLLLDRSGIGRQTCPSTSESRQYHSSVDPAIALSGIEEEGRSDSDEHYTASQRHWTEPLF
jgi:hypothetical protein